MVVLPADHFIADVESFTRIESTSLSMRMIAPVAERLYVQWPELAGRHRRARYAGDVFGGPAP